MLGFKTILIFGSLALLIPTIAIAQGAITFYDKVIITDNDTNTNGWDPNNSETQFKINEPNVKYGKSMVFLDVQKSASNDTADFCSTDWLSDGFFNMTCIKAPATGSELHYMIINSE
jgi:hypothetical protein